MKSRRRITAAFVGLLILVAGGWLERHALTDRPQGGQPVAVISTATMPVRPLSQLPSQAAQVWQLIQQGGPFPYRQDGGVFGNREGRLPSRQAGYYREYTVPIPGSHDRGPRRLITGGGAELYYTGDHYVTFIAVDPHG